MHSFKVQFAGGCSEKKKAAVLAHLLSKWSVPFYVAALCYFFLCLFVCLSQKQRLKRKKNLKKLGCKELGQEKVAKSTDTFRIRTHLINRTKIDKSIKPY